MAGKFRFKSDNSAYSLEAMERVRQESNHVSKNFTYIVLNSLYSNISIHILHILLYTFTLVLTRRICLTIKASNISDHFLNSHNLDEQLNSITVRRNYMLVTVSIKGLNKLTLKFFCWQRREPLSYCNQCTYELSLSYQLWGLKKG